MNSVERNKANIYLQTQEALQTSAGSAAIKYAEEHGKWEAHRDRVFAARERRLDVEPEPRLTDEQLAMQEVLKNY